MKILFYGVFDGKKWRSEYPILEGFQQAGVQAFTSNFRSYWPWKTLSDWEKYRHQADLVFIQNGIPFKTEHLPKFDKPIVLLASEFDVNVHLPVLKSLGAKDFVLAHSQQTFEWCQTHQIASKRIHHAANPHHYFKQAIDYQYELCFIGGMTPRRQKILQELRQKGINVFASTCWKPQEINSIYNQSKFILHIHAQEQNYLPTRFFEAIQTQGCLLIEEMGQNADPSLDSDAYLSWSHSDHLIEVIQNCSEEQRKKIVQKANQLAPQHTWHQRVYDYIHVFQDVIKSY